MTVPSFVRQTFVAGLLALLPMYITYKILSLVFELVDKPLGERIDLWLSDAAGYDVHVPGLGLLATLAIVLVIGTFMRSVVFRRTMGLVDAMIDRVPIVRSLYSASRQLVSPFAEKDKMPFKEVCLVEYPMKGRYSLAFVARPRLSDDPQDDRMVVFIPTNHIYVGNAVIVSRADAQMLAMTVDQAIKFIMTGGIVADEHLFRLPVEEATAQLT